MTRLLPTVTGGFEGIPDYAYCECGGCEGTLRGTVGIIFEDLSLGAVISGFQGVARRRESDGRVFAF